jgi:hypothetical protein
VNIVLARAALIAMKSAQIAACGATLANMRQANAEHVARMIFTNFNMKQIDLDEVLLSADAIMRWQEIIKQAARSVAAMQIDPRTVTDEQAELLKDGTLKIFVVVSEDIEVSMTVPRDQWAYRMPNN